MGSKPKSVSAPQADYSADIGKFVSAYGASLPQILGFEKQFRPEFQALNLQDISSFLGGTDGQQGLFDLGRMAAQEAGKQLGEARGSELGQMTGQAPLARGLMEKLSPEQAAAVKEASRVAEASKRLESDFMGRSKGMMDRYGSKVGTYAPTLGDISGYAGTTISDEQAQSLYDTGMAQTLAEESFARRGTLSPEEQRAAQQQAREAGAASGRLGGNAAIAAEIQNREAAMAARRAEASTLGERAATQGMDAEKMRLVAQQARYGQLSQEKERELTRRQNLFLQGITGSSQNVEERRLGFTQLADIEERRRLAREEAALANMRPYTIAGGFYTQPGLALLSQQPLSYQTGQGMLGLGMGGMKQGTPGLIQPDVGLNLGAAERQNMLQAQMATQQARAAHSAAMWSAIGEIGGQATKVAGQKWG